MNKDIKTVDELVDLICRLTLERDDLKCLVNTVAGASDPDEAWAVAELCKDYIENGNGT